MRKLILAAAAAMLAGSAMPSADAQYWIGDRYYGGYVYDDERAWKDFGRQVARSAIRLGLDALGGDRRYYTPYSRYYSYDYDYPYRPGRYVSRYGDYWWY